jgi:hypothetical protein
MTPGLATSRSFAVSEETVATPTTPLVRVAASSIASEVHIQQAHGRVRRTDGPTIIQPPPEGGVVSSQGPAQGVPVTCNQQNASSPACYTATQQAHPSR